MAEAHRQNPVQSNDLRKDEERGASREKVARVENKTRKQLDRHEASLSEARKAPDGHELTEKELRRIEELEQRDRKVRAHEQAHIAAGGRYVRSGATYHYETGPDGKKYATGGEVSIDTSEEKDPEATKRKMETVIKAALAPAQPSSQDRKVAAQASRKLAEAEAELARAASEEEQTQDSANGVRGTYINIYT